MNLEGANSGGLGDGSPPAGSRGGAPVGGLGDFVPLCPPEADDFSQLKGYLDVTSGILGAMAPLTPLNPPVPPHGTATGSAAELRPVTARCCAAARRCAAP